MPAPMLLVLGRPGDCVLVARLALRVAAFCCLRQSAGSVKSPCQMPLWLLCACSSRGMYSLPYALSKGVRGVEESHVGSRWIVSQFAGFM